ncbi:norsolorinic acid reductase [Aspergillus terreus NIH2624]|uniref:Norsolorinic acid reductase n=1 Tax=Aspergillus terreus (strain NIH 2624 / FGSC A1156) TaxID=341663 RepID=Q0CZ87_ASPTN|nr:norsolorinic acid reductase [Aspergillus terreus NIH2624]EAU37754.1 norsolorinic acid reductase [Aspergillus terreus NIH2624]
MAFELAQKPISRLRRYRLLAPSAGLRVSPLGLGSMAFGEKWLLDRSAVLGKCEKPTVFEILDFFYEQGGNFIDTANNYQEGESEAWIGEWMVARSNREELIIATKYSSAYTQDGSESTIRANRGGNATKSMVQSLEKSLQRLQTRYVDILYVHYWDFTTSIPELMQSLNHLVASGKVLYLGVSDTPAWIVVKANEYARHHGLRQFSMYQGRWSAAQRDMETDIVPMCQAEGMAIVPWGTLGGGKLKHPRDHDPTQGRQFPDPPKEMRKIGEKIRNLAEQMKTHPTALALAYIMSKAPYTFPIVGVRTVEQLKQNLQALELQIDEGTVRAIDQCVPFDTRFPLSFLAGENIKGAFGPEDVYFTKECGTFDFPARPRAIPNYREETGDV